MKMTSKGVFVLITVCFLASCSGNGNNFGEKVKQVSIHRVDSMPDMPETYKMLDWKQKAKSMTSLFLTGIIKAKSDH